MLIPNSLMSYNSKFFELTTSSKFEDIRDHIWANEKRVVMITYYLLSIHYSVAVIYIQQLLLHSYTQLVDQKSVHWCFKGRKLWL